ncbi:MAG: Rad52/Rad22 family DNA repair protein [Planctomycetota bacterium]
MNIDDIRTKLDREPPQGAVFSDPLVASGHLYLKGAYMDSLANELFGQENINTAVSRLDLHKDLLLVTATVRVRITWPGLGMHCEREDAGAAPVATPKKDTAFAWGMAWETAVKAACTDARKNALRSLGLAFGLDLETTRTHPTTGGNSKPSKRQTAEEAADEVSGVGPKANGTPTASARPRGVTKLPPPAATTGEVPVKATDYWLLANSRGRAAGIKPDQLSAISKKATQSNEPQDWAAAIEALHKTLAAAGADLPA